MKKRIQTFNTFQLKKLQLKRFFLQENDPKTVKVLLQFFWINRKQQELSFYSDNFIKSIQSIFGRTKVSAYTVKFFSNFALI